MNPVSTQYAAKQLGAKSQQTNRDGTACHWPWKTDWVVRDKHVGGGNRPKRQFSKRLRCYGTVTSRYGTGESLVVFRRRPAERERGARHTVRPPTRMHVRAATTRQRNSVVNSDGCACARCNLQSLKVANTPCRRFFPSRSNTAPSPPPPR